MTWQSATCFRRRAAVLVGAVLVGAVLVGAVLVGAVLVGAALARATSVTGKVTVTGGEGRHRKNLAGVVVWLEPLGKSVVPVPVRARMIQKNKTFTPHVLAAPMGSTVDFPNFDPIFHNAFSNYNGQIFDVGLYPPGKSRPVVFREPGVVRVFCNIHPAMSAVIVVLDTPYFAVTSAEGTFTIGDVPVGKYRLEVFDERATPETLRTLRREIEAGAENTAPEELRISEAGYIPVPHTNKYGRVYPRDGSAETYPSIP